MMLNSSARRLARTNYLSHSAPSALQFRSVSSTPRNMQKFQEIAEDLRASSRVVVAAGAGLSTASGIPDFRTPGSGLYHHLEKYGESDPKVLFDIDYFKQDPRKINALAKDFLTVVDRSRPNLAHFFLRLLHDEGKLVRVYTQNVDELELKAGLPEDKVVLAHSSFRRAHCMSCGTPAPVDRVKKALRRDEDPRCVSCGGLVRFDVVLYGETEEMPKSFEQYKEDCENADYLICIGTSLQEFPFAEVVDAVSAGTPRLLLNRDLVGSFGRRPRDALQLGELDDTMPKLANAMGWGEKLAEIARQ